MSSSKSDKGKEPSSGDDGSDKVDAESLPQTDLAILVKELREMKELLKRVVDGKTSKDDPEEDATKADTEALDKEMLESAAVTLGEQMPTPDSLANLRDCFLAIAGLGSNYMDPIPNLSFESTSPQAFMEWQEKFIAQYGDSGTFTVIICPAEAPELGEKKRAWDNPYEMQELQKYNKVIEDHIKNRLWPKEFGWAYSHDRPATRLWQLTETIFSRATLRLYSLASEDDNSNGKIPALVFIGEDDGNRVGVIPPLMRAN